MADVTIDTNPTVVEQIKAQAKREADVTDSQGRKIHLVKPPALAQFRLVEMLGASSSNVTLLGMYAPLLFISSIDGVQVPPPQTRLELDALVSRLDDDGLQAVMFAVNANFGEQDQEAMQAEVKK